MKTFKSFGECLVIYLFSWGLVSLGFHFCDFILGALGLETLRIQRPKVGMFCLAAIVNGIVFGRERRVLGLFFHHVLVGAFIGLGVFMIGQASQPLVLKGRDAHFHFTNNFALAIFMVILLGAIGGVAFRELIQRGTKFFGAKGSD